MVNPPNDIGFIHDIASLDQLRKQAVAGDEASEHKALQAAARQFEAIFTTMMLKSMRDANSEFKSDLFNSQNEDFYQQMHDEQMTSELSASGSLGLADMIVSQLSASQSMEPNTPDRFQEAMRRVENSRALAKETKSISLVSNDAAPVALKRKPTLKPSFGSPQEFIQRLTPYADTAAKALGVKPSLLLAQAALETGWGKKIIQNHQGSSHNLFNIKADKSWEGDKVATQTLEYHQRQPVMEKASFRAYSDYHDSFQDYVRFLEVNPRYQNALQHGGNDANFIQGIHHAGYATDPLYADKVLRVQAQIEQMASS